MAGTSERDFTDTISLKVRMAEWLRKQLEEAAVRSRRSLNAEVISRLEASLVYRDVVIKPRQPGGKPEPMFEESLPTIPNVPKELSDTMLEVWGDIMREELLRRTTMLKADEQGSKSRMKKLFDAGKDFREVMLEMLKDPKGQGKEQPTLEQEMETFVKEQTKGHKERQADKDLAAMAERLESAVKKKRAK
jgi:hypothetical protein